MAMELSLTHSYLSYDTPFWDPSTYEPEHDMPETDLRKEAQEHKRFAAHKHKWALGAVETRGRPGHPRPNRPVETYRSYVRRCEVEGLVQKAGKIRKHPAPELNTTPVVGELLASDSSSDDMEGGACDPPADAGVMYSFDAKRSPGNGSQILNGALARAVERFEERETLRLVKNEYDVLDSEGESVMVGRAKGKATSTLYRDQSRENDDDEYEFI